MDLIYIKKYNLNNIYFFYVFLKVCTKTNKLYILICLIIIYLIFISPVNKDIKICLCVIAKNENLYVREFVEYYKKIGYNNIFIYDNNDINGEHFEDVINDYIQNNFVQIINFRERNTNTRPTFDAYEDCYSKNFKKYNWISFYDMDEFLILHKKYKTIQNFLNDKIFEKCINIKINWILSKNDQVLYFENKPLLERIKIFDYKDPANIHIKSTIRGNLPMNYWKNTNNPHSSLWNFTSCSSSGNIVEYNSPFVNPPDFTNAHLKHFYYKSFEEFCIKAKRGKCDMTKQESNKLVDSTLKIIYEQNKNNPEKLKIINKIFNNTLFK